MLRSEAVKEKILEGKRSDVDVMDDVISISASSRNPEWIKILEKVGVVPGTAAYDNAIEQAYIMMRKSYPYLSYLCSEMGRQITFEVPTAAVGFDGVNMKLFLNPDFMAFLGIVPQGSNSYAWSREQAALFASTILAHECGHVIMRHPIRKLSCGEDDKKYIDTAMELVVNSMFLSDNIIPKHALTVKKFFALDQRDKFMAMFPAKLSVDAYINLLKLSSSRFDPTESSSGRGNGKGTPTSDMEAAGPGTSDGDLLDDHGMWEKARELFEEIGEKSFDEALKAMVRRADYKAKQAGHTPGNCAEIIDELLKSDTVPFGDLIQGLVARHVNHSRRSSPMRPSKRTEIPPGRRQDMTVEAHFYVDTSGSMSTEDIAMIMSEAVTAERNGTVRVMIQQFDCVLQGKLQTARDFEDKRVIHGRGGTDLGLVFDQIRETAPDIAFIATDGWVGIDWSKMPNTPIAWVITNKGQEPKKGLIARLPPNRQGRASVVMK